MRVELGTPNPVGEHNDPGRRPVITYAKIPDIYGFRADVDTEEWRKHLTNAVMRNNGITNFDGEGGEQALSVLTHPGGAFHAVSAGDPTWVWSDNPAMSKFLSEYYQIPEGYPAFVEETHWRRVGGRLVAPGVPSTIPEVNGLLTNVGVAMISNTIGGGINDGTSGTATGTSATTLTTGAITSVTSNQYAGAIIVTPTAWANIVSHTSGTTPVFTVDQWYSFASPGGSAASTPGSTTTWAIVSQNSSPAQFMGITNTNITPAATDTALSGEATANGMGRAITTFVITSAAASNSETFTESCTFTYTGGSAITFYALGLFNSIVKADVTNTMFWETSFSGPFTVANSGDTATVTDTITAS